MRDVSPAEISGQSAEHSCIQSYSGALHEITKVIRRRRASMHHFILVILA
jgi:hypothetical protein